MPVSTIRRPTFRSSSSHIWSSSVSRSILFNIYVADMRVYIHGKGLQSTDDINIYYHTMVIDLQGCTEVFGSEMEIKTVLFSTPLMRRSHTVGNLPSYALTH